ncbi:uncharacterized protein GJ701_015046 [Geothlypis trichas]
MGEASYAKRAPIPAIAPVPLASPGTRQGRQSSASTGNHRTGGLAQICNPSTSGTEREAWHESVTPRPQPRKGRLGTSPREGLGTNGRSKESGKGGQGSGKVSSLYQARGLKAALKCRIVSFSSAGVGQFLLDLSVIPRPYKHSLSEGQSQQIFRFQFFPKGLLFSRQTSLANSRELASKSFLYQPSRIIEWFGLEGTLKPIQCHPLPWAGTPSTAPGCSKPHPTCPWTLLGIQGCSGHPVPFLAALPGIPSSRRKSSRHIKSNNPLPKQFQRQFRASVWVCTADSPTKSRVEVHSAPWEVVQGNCVEQLVLGSASTARGVGSLPGAVGDVLARLCWRWGLAFAWSVCVLGGNPAHGTEQALKREPAGENLALPLKTWNFSGEI